MEQERNPFNPTFGTSTKATINREIEALEVKNSFDGGGNNSNIYIITGIRGIGKTSLLNSIFKYYQNKKEWITININPMEDILEQIASGIYNDGLSKLIFTKKEINFSFSGFGFKISGDEPISDINYLLRKLLKIVKDKKKKVLVSIDEVSPNKNISSFVHAFQILYTEGYPIYTLMSGLYENVSSLENEKNLTFLYRAPKIELSMLDLKLVQNSYKDIFDLSDDDARVLAKATCGYPYAYQVLGSLLWMNQTKEIDSEILAQYDSILSKRSYEKIWSELPTKERDVLYALANTENGEISEITSQGIKQNELSVYRFRLMRKGLISSKERGTLFFTLPRFKEFIQNYYYLYM